MQTDETHHLSTRTVERFWEGALSPEETSVLEDHLGECAECAELLAQQGAPLPSRSAGEARVFAAALAGEPPGAEHLSYLDLEGHVNGDLAAADEQRVLEHCRSCAACREDVRQMRVLRQELETEPLGVLQPARRGFFGLLLLPQFLGSALGLALFALLFLGRQVVELRSQSNSGEVARLASALEAERRQAEAAEQMLRQDLKRVTNRLQAISAQNQNIRAGAEAVKERLGKRLQVARAQQESLQAEQGRLAKDLEAAQRRLRALERSGEPVVAQASPDEALRRLLDRGLPPAVVSAPRGGIPRSPELFQLTPRNTNVRAARPELRWRAIPNATSYQVRIYGADGGAVAESPALSQTSWTPPVDLDGGREYRWLVEAYRAGEREPFRRSADGPGSAAVLRVLSLEDQERLSERLRAAPPTLVGRIGVLTEFGLLEEATAEVDRLREHLPSGDLPDRLLKRIRQRQEGERGRP